MSEVMERRAAARPAEAGTPNPKLEEWHPLLPNPTREEVEGMLARPGGAAAYAEFVNLRRRRMRLADEDTGDPLYHGFELPHWAEADEQLRLTRKSPELESGFLYVAGGKRASKSEWAAKRFVHAAMTFPKSVMWAFQAGEGIGTQTQHKLIWRYLPREVKAMNAPRRHGFTKINYSQDGGFTEGVLVLPNRTEIHFMTYKMDPKGYQGGELGVGLNDELRERMAADPQLNNIGAWLDEDAPLTWVETVEFRCSTRGAKVVWTFSTMDGITTAVKEVLGTPKTVKSRRASLFPANQRLVRDCPPGEMPYLQVCSRTGWRAMYFHTDLNPFGANWPEVRGLCENKPFAYAAENAYGWSEDARGKAFPLFSGVNVVEAEEVPGTGTNYFFTDPAGARNWASMWVRVTDENPARYFVYRDWPEAQRYGPWAEPSKREGELDGQPGRAQRSLGLGYAQLKGEWLKRERIWIAQELRDWSANAKPAEGASARPQTPNPNGDELPGWVEERLKREYPDGQARRRVRGLLLSGEAVPEFLQEEIHERYIDPRAGRDERTAREGTTCAVDELMKEDVDKQSGERIPALRFFPAPGLAIETGINAVNGLLFWKTLEAYCRVMNEPRLYVSRECQQVIWMLGNYTGSSGETGACKDFADLLRYMALARLRYVGDGKLKTTGGGSY
jgi:hypothetical protein